MLSVKGRQSHLHQSQLLQMLLLLQDLVLQIVVVDVVLPKGHVVAISQTRPSRSAKIMALLRLPHKRNLFFYCLNFLLFYHRKAIPHILPRSRESFLNHHQNTLEWLFFKINLYSLDMIPISPFLDLDYDKLDEIL